LSASLHKICETLLDLCSRQRNQLHGGLRNIDYRMETPMIRSAATARPNGIDVMLGLSRMLTALSLALVAGRLVYGLAPNHAGIVFLITLLSVSLLFNAGRAGLRSLAVAVGLFVLGVLPMIESLDAVSAFIGACGLLFLGITIARPGMIRLA
jgi:small-conductance mechanosensitive channel